MSFVAEDGTGLATANSYVATAEASQYHDELGNSAWAAAAEELRELALRRATRYIDGRYAFVGCVAVPTQALKWPRTGAFDTEGRLLSGVPVQVREACLELALHLAEGGSVEAATAAEGAIRRQRVGPIETEYAEIERGREFPFVSRLLAGLTVPRGLDRA
ncbi:DnaT-like ssDNA-binding protein [Oceanibacterium hippocampi]|uniref:Putative DnaT-like domain-containing protein n=1 Tax=Oceanibacterium hippocampi TaxID=745714 RepID=A0A1Y5S3G9_9PROT|nr:DnaT-like ssDNA-binding protein [Oceanibacterium hippocampi]SLN31768.1 hypothetical protein OCH7691_01152 [Oceanibacterium hippocampi]